MKWLALLIGGCWVAMAATASQTVVLTGALEVSIQTDPVFRVLSVTRPEREEPQDAETQHTKTRHAEPWLRSGPEGTYGVRLAFMAPGQIATSFATSQVPAELIGRDERSATFRLKVAQGLRYQVSVAVDPVLPKVELAYRLTREAMGPQDPGPQVAIWSVTAVERQGVMVAPLCKQERGLRQTATPSWAQMPQPAMRWGVGAMTWDLGGDVAGSAAKVGLHSEPGWAALVRGREAMITHSPRREGMYPEGDANVTLFQYEPGEHAWAELEQVGPLVELGIGQSTALQETLWLVPLPEPVDAQDPDAARQAVEKAWLAVRNEDHGR